MLLMVLSKRKKAGLVLKDSLVDLRYVQRLMWPQDRATIAQLDLEEKIMWYSGQDAREMVYLGQNKDFKKFWYWHYLLPLRSKRFVFKIRRFLINCAKV